MSKDSKNSSKALADVSVKESIKCKWSVSFITQKQIHSHDLVYTEAKPRLQPSECENEKHKEFAQFSLVGGSGHNSYNEY